MHVLGRRAGVGWVRPTGSQEWWVGTHPTGAKGAELRGDWGEAATLLRLVQKKPEAVKRALML